MLARDQFVCMAIALSASVGCSGKPGRLAFPDIPSNAGENAVSEYDANGNEISDTKFDQFDAILESLMNRTESEGEINRSVSDWIKAKNATYFNDPLGQWQLSAYTEFDSGADISDLSSRYCYADEVFSNQDAMVTNGYVQLATYLAQNVPIRLNEIVQSIEYAGTYVNVQTSQGKYHATKLICTLPLGVLKSGSVRFSPDLPAPHQTALNRMKMGTVNKVALTFPQKFWDDAQYIGFMDAVKGRFNFFVNMAEISNVNALVTFGFGNYAVQMEQMSDAAIKDAAMTNLRHIYGNAIPNPTRTIITRWSSDPFAKGSYSFPAVGSTPWRSATSSGSVRQAPTTMATPI